MVEPPAALTAALDALAAVDLDAAATAALGEQLQYLNRHLARLEGEFQRRLERFDRAGGAGAAGSPSTAAWLRHHCRIAPGEASSRVSCARRLADSLPGTAAALAAGEILLPHAAVLARASTGIDLEQVAAAEPTLLDAARRLHPGRLRSLAVHWRHVIDAEASGHEAQAHHEQRYLSISTTLGGTVALDGMLDAEDGAILLTAIAALAAPGPDDERTAKQRRADALVELARRSLDAGQLPETGGERPHLNITVDLDTLRAQPGSRAADSDWTGPISGENARRLACDAAVTRIITNGPSEILDVGRRTRTIPPGLRKAVTVRDRHCTHPGCDRPPPWCDVHHIRHWADGGDTTLANLTLRCRYHHRLAHNGRWQIPRPRQRPQPAQASCSGGVP